MSSFIVTAVWMMWTTYMGHTFAEGAKGYGEASRYDLPSSQHLAKHQFGHSDHKNKHKSGQKYGQWKGSQDDENED